jgi:hypothetical protein
MTDLRDDRDLADFVPTPTKGVAGSPTGWLIAHGIAWGVWLVVLIVAVRTMEVIFQDFGVDLPGMTVFFIKVAHAKVLLAPAVLILLLLDRTVLNARHRRGDARGFRTWAIAMMALPILLFAATTVALVLPLADLMARLAG